MTTMRKRAVSLKARGFTTMGRRRHEDARFYGGSRWSKREIRFIAARSSSPLVYNQIKPAFSIDEQGTATFFNVILPHHNKTARL